MEADTKPESTEATKPEAKKEDRILVRDVSQEGASAKQELRFTKVVHVVAKDEDGKSREGDFTYKRPTIAGQARIGVLMAELRLDKPPSSIDIGTARMHEWMAVCKVMVVASPSWWDVDTEYDVELVQRVAEGALAYLNTFLR